MIGHMTAANRGVVVLGVQTEHLLFQERGRWGRELESEGGEESRQRPKNWWQASEHTSWERGGERRRRKFWSGNRLGGGKGKQDRKVVMIHMLRKLKCYCLKKIWGKIETDTGRLAEIKQLNKSPKRQEGKKGEADEKLCLRWRDREWQREDDGRGRERWEELDVVSWLIVTRSNSGNPAVGILRPDLHQVAVSQVLQQLLTLCLSSYLHCHSPERKKYGHRMRKLPR